MPEQVASTFNVPVDKLLEDAEDTGTLHLTGRKMSIFPPTASSFDLSDVIEVDISENRFVELPESMNAMASLEKLICFNNVLRQVPDMTSLESLVHLDLGRNHLSRIPAHLCRLPIKELILSHNRLVSLPDEIGNLSSLMDLDVSGNELVGLPESMGHLINLRDLNVRRNHLVALPNSLTSLQLVRLDISVNRIAKLPLSLIKMKSLMTFILHDNPLTVPPSNVCIRGRVHIFKYLKEELDKSKDGGSYSSRNSTSRRELRGLRLRRGVRHSPMRAEALSPSPRVSRSLEEEMENLASKHGLDWSQKKTVKHDYAELEPLPLGKSKAEDDDDTTPKCSPTRPTALLIEEEEPVANHMPNGIKKQGPPLEKPPPPAEILEAQKTNAKASPKSSPATNRRPLSGKAISRPLSASAIASSSKTPPNRRAASARNMSPKQQRPLSTGPKPKLAAKPSAQEIAAKTTTKKRLEMEWLEKQREQEKLSRQRQRELAMKRKAAEREQYVRNREQNARRISVPSSPSGPPAVTDEQFEKARQEQNEIMAAAEASRQNWQQRERAETMKGSESQEGLSDGKAPASSLPKSSSFQKSTEYLERVPQLQQQQQQQQRGMDRQYTVKRLEREAKKEFATIDSLRKLLENALQQELPSEMLAALSNGVVLCNLVNQLRPNTISVIYTPPHRDRAGAGPAKLSALKSVKNVDAFILGCKKIGLDSGLVCSPADILEMKDPLHVYITVRALVNRCSESRESAMV